LSSKHSLAVLCQIAKVSRSGYYKFLKNSLYKNKDDYLLNKIVKIQEKSKSTYGYRKITAILNSDSDIKHNNKKIYRIMKDNQQLSVIRKKRKWYGKNLDKPSDNIINRNFKSDKPLEKIVTDVTEFKIFNRKVYLSAILDLYNNEVIEYKISNRGDLKLVASTVDNLIKNNNNLCNTIFHSDQGFQYTNKYFRKKLANYGIVQSMSRKGNPLDNACIENFFGILKSELIYNKTVKFKNYNDFIIKLKKWILYYNKERIQTKLGNVAPKKYKKAI